MPEMSAFGQEENRTSFLQVSYIEKLAEKQRVAEEVAVLRRAQDIQAKLDAIRWWVSLE